MCIYTLIIYVSIHKYINTVSLIYTHTVTMENKERESKTPLFPVT